VALCGAGMGEGYWRRQKDDFEIDLVVMDGPFDAESCSTVMQMRLGITGGGATHTYTYTHTLSLWVDTRKRLRLWCEGASENWGTERHQRERERD
jgi:hypothetical protein